MFVPSSGSESPAGMISQNQRVLEESVLWTMTPQFLFCVSLKPSVTLCWVQPVLLQDRKSCALSRTEQLLWEMELFNNQFFMEYHTVAVFSVARRSKMYLPSPPTSAALWTRQCHSTPHKTRRVQSQVIRTAGSGGWISGQGDVLCGNRRDLPRLTRLSCSVI